MLKFREPRLEDVPALRKLYEKYGTMGSDCNPVNIFLWRKKYNVKICTTNGFLVKAYYNQEGKPWAYSFPVGSGDLKSALNEILADAKERNIKVNFVMLTLAQKELLVKNTDDNYTFTELKGDEDYIYTNYNLATLPGRKYHNKRNHIAKFNRLYRNWEFKVMTKEHQRDALYIAEKWCESHNINYMTDYEYKAISECFRFYDFLKVHGGILYVEGQPVAMTIGAGIDQSTFDIMFEKALTEFDGSYAKINNEFAKTLVGFEFINREEDMGIEALKKAKESYHPTVVLERFIGVRND